MDYFQGIVENFLRSDRAMFVHGEFLMDLDANEMEPNGLALKGRHWYCDVAAMNMRERTLFLGEVTFSKTLQALTKRLGMWAQVWSDLRAALSWSAAIPLGWAIVPWVFIPSESHDLLKRRLVAIENCGNGKDQMPTPRVTFLEDVVPWKYAEWNNRPSSLDRAAQQVGAADAASRRG